MCSITSWILMEMDLCAGRFGCCCPLGNMELHAFLQWTKQLILTGLTDILAANGQMKNNYLDFLPH